MAEQEPGSRRPGFLETLREGWKPAGRRAETSSSSPPEHPRESKGSGGSEATTATSPQPTAAKADAKSPATDAAAAAAAGSKPPATNIDERMEGIQGWMAELERRQRRTTYFGSIAVVLAAAAAAAALFFAITTPNSASKDDFDDLEAEMRTLQEQVSEATTDQARLKELNTSIQALGARVAAGEQKANQTATDIASLKTQVAQAAASQAATPAPTPTPTPAPAPTTPGGSKP